MARCWARKSANAFQGAKWSSEVPQGRSFASLHAATKIDFQAHEPARNASFSVWQLAGEEGARETTPCATALLFHMRALSDLTKLLELAIAVPYVIILVAERDNNHAIPALNPTTRM